MSGKTICIIPARGGSKRIPKKNIKEFCGKPLISYAIKCAIDSGVFDEVLVSTESEEIKEVALSCGAKVPFERSMLTAGDYAPVGDAVKEVLEQKNKVGESVESICCIYATSVFISPLDLRESHQLHLNSKGWVLPVVEFGFPVLRGLVENQGKMTFRWPEYASSRSQDLQKFYHDAGQFFWVTADEMGAMKELGEVSYTPYHMEAVKCQDIDTLEDWEVAEFKFNYLNSKK